MCVACVASGWKPALTEASHQTFHIFTTQRYAKRGICRRRVSVCLSVCLSPPTEATSAGGVGENWSLSTRNAL